MKKLLFISAIAFAAGVSGPFPGYGFAQNQGPVGSGSGQTVHLGVRSGFVTTVPLGLGGGAGEEGKTRSQPKENAGPEGQQEQEQYGVAPEFGGKRTKQEQGWVRFRKNQSHTGWQRKHNVPKNGR